MEPVVDDTPLVVGNVPVSLGERVTIDLPVANLYTHGEVTMPVHVARGKKPGPVLFVSAALHGDEINGVEVIHRLLRSKHVGRMRGALIAVPVVNVYGLLSHSRYLPDRRDLNRMFPGSESGSLAARMARIFMTEVVAKSTHGIDLHTGAVHRTNLPQVRASLDQPGVGALARAFDVPVIVHADTRDGSLRAAAQERGIPTVVYEGGEALRFDPIAIRAGFRGVVNVMRSLGMLPPPKKPVRNIDPVVTRTTHWVRAAESGILRMDARLGLRVAEGRVLGTIGDPFGARELPVVAPFSGVIIGHTQIPLVNEGDALFHLARFEESAPIAEVLEAFQSEYEVPWAFDPEHGGT